MTAPAAAYAATCITLGARGIVVEGPPGSGKSTLALSLIDRGAMLVGDDGICLEEISGHLVATPHPNTRGLLEVRNLGLLTFPVREKVEVALVLRLDPQAPRYIEEAEATHLYGVELPLIRLWPDSPALHLRAELALERYGRPPAC